MTTLACGHDVDLQVGTRIYNIYDPGFGTLKYLSSIRDEPGGPWHDYISEGSTYWPLGRMRLLNPDRLYCEPCGLEEAAAHG